MRRAKRGKQFSQIIKIRLIEKVMKSFCKIALLGLSVVAAQDIAATGSGDMTGSASELAPAVTLITGAIVQTKDASAKEAKLCLEEQDATTLWDKTVNTPESRAEAKGNRAARLAAKKELAGALANRLKVLQAFLEKLYTARQRLGGHIHRVNDIFQTVYGVNTQTQVNAAETIKLLGISVSQPHSPMFKPIKLPKHEEEADAAEAAKLENEDPDQMVGTKPEASEAPETPEPVVADTESPAEAASAADDQQDAVLSNDQANESATADEKDEQLADATDLADAAASTASFMELESKVQQYMQGCSGEDCSHAYTAAFGLYKTTYTVNKANVEHFENERKALGGFRDGLKALIKKKEDKMAALAAQLKELEASMANPGPTLESLFKMIKQHFDVNKASCALMAGRTKTMLQLLSDPNGEGFLELVKAGKVDCQGEMAPVVVAESEPPVTTVESVESVEPVQPVIPEPPVEEEEVPPVKESPEPTEIPAPPANGESSEIINIDTGGDDNKGDEIFSAQV